MSLRTPALLATLATLVVLGAGPGTAAANVWGHQTTTTGNVVAAGTNLDAVLKPLTSAVINSSIGSITCTASSLQATSGASGGATVALTVTTVSLSTCSDTIAVITVTGCTLYMDMANTLSMATGTMAMTAATVTSIPMPTTLTVRCVLASGAGFCYVRINNQTGTATYTFNGGGVITSSELDYNAVPALKPMTPASNGLCPSLNMTLAVTWSSLKVVAGTLVGFNNVA